MIELSQYEKDMKFASEIEELAGGELVEATTEDQNLALKFFLQELEDPEEYARKDDLLNENLLKYFDNPEMPSEVEKNEMMSAFKEDSMWFDKWIRDGKNSSMMLSTETSKKKCLKLKMRIFWRLLVMSVWRNYGSDNKNIC